MIQNHKIFMLVVETKSFKEAAKRAYVSQQCVSDHVSRIENEFGTKLFNRKPFLHLTAAGEVVYKSLSNIDAIEKNLNKQMDELKSGVKGNFTVGISTSRSPIILPKVLKKYNKLFPNIIVKFVSGDTAILEKYLENNTVDLFLGINTNLNLNFEVQHICNDYIYMIIHKNLFYKFFDNSDLQSFRHGVDLNNFSEVPMIMYYKTGAMYTLMQQHLISHGVKLNNIPFYTSECETQIKLCIEGVACALVPKMLYTNFEEKSDIFVFPIKGLEYPLRVEIVKKKNINLPNYINAFCNVLKNEIIEISD